MEDKFKGTKLTLEIDEVKVTWESPYTDHSVEDILTALRGLMVTQTFIDESFVRSCGELYDENICLYEKEKEDN